MPTQKQKMAAKKISENIGKKTTGELLRESGYSRSISETPELATKGKGFKEEMAKYGLTEELISCSLVDDIKKKPQARKGELELGAKILRMGQDDDNTKPIVVLSMSTSDLPPEQRTRLLLEKLKYD